LASGSFGHVNPVLVEKSKMVGQIAPCAFLIDARTIPVVASHPERIRRNVNHGTQATLESSVAFLGRFAHATASATAVIAAALHFATGIAGALALLAVPAFHVVARHALLHRQMHTPRHRVTTVNGTRVFVVAIDFTELAAAGRFAKGVSTLVTIVATLVVVGAA